MTYQFKIQLQGIKKPPVWRRLSVPANITFDMFHELIQAAFGWENCHLYQFSEKGRLSEIVYKLPDEEDDEEAKDSTIVEISEVFTTVKQTLTYIYDFGDDWEHNITLEAILDEHILNPRCLAGKGACPPEDCGGLPGYLHLVAVLSSPKDPEYKDMRAWLGLGKGQQWDVNEFYVGEANENIRDLYS